jgi:hypothetical protein
MRIDSSGNVTVSGDLTVEGTTTTINSTTLTVDDKNIELGSVDSPTDATADGGGITLKGATDKTILWTNSTDSWDFNQNVKVTGTLDATSDFAIATNKFTVAASSGNTVVAGTLDATGDLKVNTDKFTVAASSGNTAVAGTLGVTGITTLAALLNADGGIAVDTDKFTVANATGNTVIDGTLTVNGLTATTTENTALFINASNEVETRDLGSLAFSSATYDNYVKWVASDAESTAGTSDINGSDTLVFEGTGSINTAVTTDKLTISADTMGSGNSYAAGFAPVGSEAHVNKFLRKDGTWVVPENDDTIDMGDGFVLEDGDGTEVIITENKEVKFVEGGLIDIDWTNTDNGTNEDPYDLTFTVDDDLANYDNSTSGFVTSNKQTTFTLRDDDNLAKTIAQDTFLKFTAATGTAGANLTGDGTDLSPWVMAITLPNDNDNTWVANSSSAAGYVASGSGQANKVWKTDGSGNPSWQTDATGGGGGNLTTKGDLEVYTTSQTRLGVGTDGYVLTADSGEASGLRWAAGGSGSGHTIQDEGSDVASARDDLNFVGELVTAADNSTDESTDVTIDAKTLWLYAA